MGIQVEVSRFAKIEKASIKTSDFLLFVGDNNSGKTLMMELLYGIIDLLSDWKADVGRAKIMEMEVLAKLDWSVQDMLQTDKTVSVYEFKQDGRGGVFVEELEFFAYPRIGYDFGRFNENIDLLYDESQCIMG